MAKNLIYHIDLASDNTGGFDKITYKVGKTINKIKPLFVRSTEGTGSKKKLKGKK